MSGLHRGGRKRARRTEGFRPAVDGMRLEDRVLMTVKGHAPYTLNQFLLNNPEPGNAFAVQKPEFLNGHTARTWRHGPNYRNGYAAVQTIRGGGGVQIATPDGSHFRLTITLADSQYDGGLTAQTGSTGNNVVPANKVQAIGTVRAYPMPGGKVGIIVDGTTSNQQLVIDPLPFPQRKGYAHSFAYGESARNHILNIGSLFVSSGKLNAVLGYHTADLSGPLTIAGGDRIDRIAFNSLQPGAAIGIGGSLNTLDIAEGVNLTTGPGISVQGDLNLLNVGQDVVLTNGSSIIVNRFLGLTPQPPKGTANGSNILSLNQSQIGSGTSQVVPSVSGYVQGNFTIGAGSVLKIGSGIAASSITSGANVSGGSPSPLVINGVLNAAQNNSVLIPGLVAGNAFITAGGASNLVARGGVVVNGQQIVVPVNGP